MVSNGTKWDIGTPKAQPSILINKFTNNQQPTMIYIAYWFHCTKQLEPIFVPAILGFKLRKGQKDSIIIHPCYIIYKLFFKYNVNKRLGTSPVS